MASGVGALEGRGEEGVLVCKNCWGVCWEVDGGLGFTKIDAC